MRGARPARVLCTFALIAGAAAALSPSPARAQAVDLRTPDATASALADLRLRHLDERRDAGVVLLLGGAASAIGGAITAGVGHESPFWLAFGIGSAGWGAINAALAFGLLDLGDGARRRAEQDRARRDDAIDGAHREALRRQHRSATLFALNLGLDVFYMGAAALLYALADQLTGPDEPDLLRGYAAAQLTQGAFLFVFDLVEWIGSESRADELARLMER